MIARAVVLLGVLLCIPFIWAVYRGHAYTNAPLITNNSLMIGLVVGLVGFANIRPKEEKTKNPGR
jgi:hypothetical protein